MLSYKIMWRDAVCSGKWYPNSKAINEFRDDPLSAAVISPHAGFDFSGHAALHAASVVKKERLWIFGTSHFENITKGLSIYPGNYRTSIGNSIFPLLSDTDENLLKEYFSDEGHRRQEHSIENVLYAVNHFSSDPETFCCLVRINDKDKFEKISDMIAKLWKKNDSIIISTDWNHFRKVKEMDALLKDVCKLLNSGDIENLYQCCKNDIYEACGIDSLYLAGMILNKVNLSSSFRILETENSANAERSFTDLCVGYIAAHN